MKKDDFYKFMIEVRDHWLHHRLTELGLKFLNLGPSLKDIGIIDNFWNDLQTFLSRVMVLGTSTYIFKTMANSDIIFEGAQGLMLDQNNKADFPFLTPSYTGIMNVVKLCDIMKIEEIEAHYVSRTYLTRHGPGPLPNEMDMGLTCQTNVENTWQGKLRYAPLDLDALLGRVLVDVLANKNKYVKIKTNLSFTHADLSRIPFVFNHTGGSRIDTIEPATIPNRVDGNPLGLVSYGPSANHVKKVLDIYGNSAISSGVTTGGEHEKVVEDGATSA